MVEKTKVKLAVIGVGGMGSVHVRDMEGIENAELVAVCDIDQERADRFAEMFAVPAFYDYRDLLAADLADAVIVATPHYDHTPIAIDFMNRGVNVLTEKPIAVHTQDGYKMIAAYEAAREKHPGLVFSIMFQQRTYGFWRKIKEMIDAGELGKLVRASWIITEWFRTQAYYDNGGWRATWSGEGGGVLLNQCPHNLDLYQWFFGLPKRVTGFAAIGKYHNIEVEDEVTAFFEYENGMVGHFLTSTGESPGTNRLEIVGENGKLVFEDGSLMFTRNESSMLDFIQTCPGSFDKVDNQTSEVEYEHHGEAGHRIMVRNFCDAILTGASLLAAGVEGIRGLTLGNAIMLSAFLNQPVDVPFADEVYAEKIAELARTSRFQKTVRKQEDTDMGKSFQGAQP
jgi:predicted dehydrogenase